MFESTLSKYQINGSFTYKNSESLREKCNAPTNHSGIYLIFNKEELIYIGSSGQKTKTGELKTRKSNLGGMKDRIVNGYHPKFGKICRKKVFPDIMRIEKIEELTFYWYVTYDFTHHHDFPTDIEKKLCLIYKEEHGNLPRWHKQKTLLLNKKH